MPQGGYITICTELKEINQIVLSIKDQGGGITEDILSKLGTPFMTTKSNGTGLGLPICYRIAERHNASIDIKTNSQGTTFFVNSNL